MRVHVEAEPGEVTARIDELVRALLRADAGVGAAGEAPLHKALGGNNEDGERYFAHPVQREMYERALQAGERRYSRMQARLRRVLAGGGG